MKHAANILTASRLALSPYVFLLIWRHEYKPLIPLFILITLTDVGDGYFARRYGDTSRLGAYLDPIADKVLLSGSFLMLALSGAIEWWVAAIVLGRDLLILAAAGILYSLKSLREFPPSVWGKISTLVQILFVGFLVGALAGVPVSPIATALKFATVLLAAISFLHYAARTIGSVK